MKYAKTTECKNGVNETTKTVRVKKNGGEQHAVRVK